MSVVGSLEVQTGSVGAFSALRSQGRTVGTTMVT